MQTIFSSEFHPKDSGWFLAPWSPTDPGWRYKLSPQTPLWLTQIDSSLGLPTINVDPTQNVYPKAPSQPVLGMGTSLEETSIYALSANHDDAQTEAALTDLIDPVSGIGMNLFRLCIGTSDFADGRSVTNDPKNNPHGWYTYQDGGPTSPFSIQHDIDLNIIHVVKLAQDVAKKTNHPIKFFASAWSPPAWMKDSKVLTGGNLLPSMIPAYAAYLRQFVQAYQAQDIPIYAITTNNEHYNNTPQYPSCVFNAQQETTLVEAIAKEFAQNNITTKIWILDHNYKESPGARTTLSGLGTNIGEADSIAYHHYDDGSPTYMASTHGSFPTTGIQFSEGSTWGIAGMDEIAQIFRNTSSSYMSWVTMTTQTPTHIQGPYNTPGNGAGSLSPTLLIRKNNTVTGTDPNPDYYKTPEYYLYGQFMKFVQPGADCIYSNSGSAATTTNVAFKNPDGTIVIVAVNQNTSEKDMRFVIDGSQFVTAVPATSVATYRFKGGLAPSTVAPVGVPVLPDPALPVVTSATTASGTVGSAFSYTITASNNPTSFGATGLSAGLSVNSSTGVISGTPSAAATSSVTLSVTNASGTVTQGLKLTVSAAPVSKPVISSATSASGTVGKAFSYQITASNSPTSFSATGLPGGLSVNTTSGLISGTPTGAGASSVSLGASNAGGTGTATLSLTVNNPPPPVPATPAGVTGFGWDAQVDLRWTASANATGYNVARSTTQTGGYTTVGNNVATPYFSDTAGLVNGTTYYYQVSAVGASGTSAPAAASVLTHASGDNAWSAGDIGAAPKAGTSDYDSGSYTLTSAGVDIWGTADAFQFMSQPLAGDGAIVARVASVSNSSPYAKAGVMIRASLAPNAANMAVFASPGTAQGITAQWRLSAGASSAQTLFTGVTAPYWVKLARAGSTFTAYRSADGVTWTLQSTQTINMTGPVYAGLAVTAHNGSGTVCTATFDSVNILPGPAWLADDLGVPAIDGFTAYNNAALTVNAAGKDIWGTSDQLRYVYQPTSGDCSVTVRMTGVENSNASAKAGVMIRETLAANSSYVDLLATANTGVYLQVRASAGAGTSDAATNVALRPPYWLRLARAGNTVTASTSPDGNTWTVLGSTPVTMGANVYIGVAATSHDASKLGTATADNISVSP